MPPDTLSPTHPSDPLDALLAAAIRKAAGDPLVKRWLERLRDGERADGQAEAEAEAAGKLPEAERKSP